MTQTDNCTPSLSLAPGLLRSLLDSLDRANQQTGEGHESRRHRRLKYRTPLMLVRVLDDHQREESVFQTTTRNISSSGLAFLHKQMLPPGKRLILTIPLLDDQTAHLAATVVHCRHIRGMIHEIGVSFLKFVDKPGP